MSVVPFAEFEKVYRESLEGVLAFCTREMQEEMAAHCRAWDPSRFDFRAYLETSVARYHRAYLALVDAGGSRVCDVGGFWGIFPATLSRLGYRVVMTEALQYYSAAFDGLFEHLRERGVEVVDYDPFEPDSPLPGEYDFVSVMAVLEHYPHSPRVFMQNVSAALMPEGRLFVEVPNVAFLPKRINLLRGVSPLTPIGEIYESAVPFIGHHHEYSQRELRELAERAGLEVVEESSFNYSPRGGGWKYRMVMGPVEWLAFRLLPDSRECLTITCRRAGPGAMGS